MAFPTPLDATNPSESILRRAAYNMRSLLRNATKWQAQGNIVSWIRQTKAPFDTDFPTDEVDAALLASESATTYRHKRLHALRNDPLELASLHTRKDVKAYADAVAQRAIIRFAAPKLLVKELAHATAQVSGTAPVHDDQGTTLSGVPAKEKRVRISNYWNTQLCDSRTINGETRNARWAKHSILAWEKFEGQLADDLPTARQQLIERLDDAIEARSMFHFGRHHPHNANQQAARYAMDAARQSLVDALEDATTIAGAQVAFTTAEGTVNATNVEGQPQFFHGSVHITASDYADTYTTGTGDSAWKLVMSIRNTGRDHASNGKVKVKLPDSDDFQFAIARQNDTSLTVTITRKGTGHPSAGGYPLTFEARNHQGAARLQLNITVPAATPPPSE